MRQIILLLAMLNISFICKAMELKEVETKNEVSALLSSRAIGEDVRAEHETYKIVPAGQVELITSSSAISTRTTSKNTTIWSAQLGGFDMSIRDAPAARSASSLLPESRYLLAYNPRTKNPAIVTGQIIVRLNSGANSADIAKDFGLTLNSDYPNINAVFYEPGRPDELMMKVGLLKLDPRILDAYPEVLENFSSPR